MRYAVDRFEEEWAVLQDDEGRCRNVERRLLPQGVRQGDVLRETEEGFLPDPEETARRRERARRLEQRLRKKG